MRLSHDPCVGVNVKVKRPMGCAASQLVVSRETWAECLFVATRLTLLFLPALYVAWFRIKEPRRAREIGLGTEAAAVAR